jgi:response regulator RpfG family c-di-GMP phosphodiesterase
MTPDDFDWMELRDPGSWRDDADDPDAADDGDDLVFAEEETPEAPDVADRAPWKVMIVDDERAVHDVTRLALQGFAFAGRGLRFISCHSGAEAKAAMRDHPDTALVLLDVVMEHEHAGLDVVHYIRDELRNGRARIVLRTGQPGEAPERDVIARYDINDYKEKTELTANKLFTLFYSTLRAYRDIATIEASKQGLLRVIDASKDIFKIRSGEHFANGVLAELSALLNLDPGALYMRAGGLACSREGGRLRLIAGTGAYASEPGRDARQLLPESVLPLVEDAQRQQRNVYGDGCFVGYFADRLGHENLLYVDGIERVDAFDRHLVELFTKNVSVAFENIHLHEDLEETQREIVYMLGEAVERRSQETGNHVKRVAEISALLARAHGLSDDEAELIKLASPLHDVGKIAIPDAVLNKPGRLTQDERDLMQTHAEVGHRMLRGSRRRILQAAAVIAHEHHERWDGGGYPRGKAGEDIHIHGRITAVADVFDALGSDRIYKDAWPLEKICNLFKEERGRHFDPALVDLLFAHLDQILAIRARHSDTDEIAAGPR